MIHIQSLQIIEVHMETQNPPIYSVVEDSIRGNCWFRKEKKISKIKRIFLIGWPGIMYSVGQAGSKHPGTRRKWKAVGLFPGILLFAWAEEEMFRADFG